MSQIESKVQLGRFPVHKFFSHIRLDYCSWSALSKNNWRLWPVSSFSFLCLFACALYCRGCVVFGACIVYSLSAVHQTTVQWEMVSEDNPIFNPTEDHKHFKVLISFSIFWCHLECVLSGLAHHLNIPWIRTLYWKRIQQNVHGLFLHSPTVQSTCSAWRAASLTQWQFQDKLCTGVYSSCRHAVTTIFHAFHRFAHWISLNMILLSTGAGTEIA